MPLFKLKRIAWPIVLGIFLILILVILNTEQEDKISLLQDLDLEENPSLVVQEVYQPLGDKLPVAVVLDNFSESWPLSGLSHASIVYEAPVEADLTRLLAIFNQDSLPDKIGPVRSARPYLADLAEEYGALFVHAGGSPDFLKEMDQNNYQVADLDEIGQDGDYFWRAWQRQKPHNLYISKQSISQVIENKKLANVLKPDFIKWPSTKVNLVRGKNFKFLEEQISDEVGPHQTTEIIKIDYQEPVIWQFDKDLQAYLRFQNGQSFVGENEEQIQAKNLIIQKTEIVVLDEIGRRFIKTTGQGQAFIFQKGFLIQGEWQRSEPGQRTKFYNLQGREIEFLPGLIWIEIVSDKHKILY
ncbi:DUF3048 domain-containing protein [Patescibacteria group bacterium]|nr:DUF3048 domain-containing protein [Patescibacteria group bacterium]